MTVLLDPAVWRWLGELWAHIVSDASYAELHAFADALGMPRRTFQGDHYDVPAGRVRLIWPHCDGVDASGRRST